MTYYSNANPDLLAKIPVTAKRVLEIGCGTGGFARAYRDINPAADEVCDGVDQDCDERVDENPLDERRPCNTGFAGRCDSGTTVCNEGLLNCEPTAEVSVELCDGVDNNCDGGVDESGVCAGEPCCFTDSASLSALGSAEHLSPTARGTSHQ